MESLTARLRRLSVAVCVAAAVVPGTAAVCREQDRPRQPMGEAGFHGIGVALELTAQSAIQIRAVIPQAGSDVKAALRKGDTILKVDGKPIQGQSISEVVGRIRGPEGTPVRLTLKRKGAAAPITVSVKRQVIRVEQ
jgi:carboxyl-terminal processing protease